MNIGVGVAHYLAPVVVLGCVALAPSTQGAGRAVASFWLALMGWWLATGNECPFSLAYKKARDPGYVTGQNMRAPDLDDLYARIEARWGLPAPAVEAGFGWAMGAALGVGAAHAVAYGGVERPVALALGVLFVGVAFVGGPAVRRSPWLSGTDRAVARLLVATGLGCAAYRAWGYR